jgi:hypothetical protein
MAVRAPREASFKMNMHCAEAAEVLDKINGTSTQRVVGMPQPSSWSPIVAANKRVDRMAYADEKPCALGGFGERANLEGAIPQPPRI